jgi:tetratricopeptide (TPR) repeat protein
MNFRVANPLARWAIFALAAAVAACVTLAAVHNEQADRAAAAANIAGFTRAAQIEPGYGFYWYALGEHLRSDPDNPNPTAAISDFLRAIADDPRDARTWMDLGDAYEETGDIPDARHAYEQAEQVYPNSSDVAWRYGSFLLRQGDTQDAYRHIRRALEITPTLAPLVISRVWRATQDTKGLLTEVLPNPEYDFAALDWFCGDGDVDPALDAWKGIVATGKPLDIRDSFKLTDLLLEAQRGDDARLVWRQAVDLSGHSAELISGPSLVFNGGFEFDSVNGGLDWIINTRDGVGYDYDTSQFHEGKRSLRVTFDGSENFDFNQVYQRVPVKPDTPYHFSAWVRTAGITTDSGPRFAITFPENLLPPVVLDGTIGDKDWTEQGADFVTGPNVHSLTILLLRMPSRKFDNKLAGTVWIDDVSLTPGTPRRQTP